MDKHKKSKKLRAPEYLPSVSDTVSFNECTGMMPVPPNSVEQWEAYKQLFSVELPETDVWHKQ